MPSLSVTIQRLNTELGGKWESRHNHDPMPNDGALHTWRNGLEHFHAEFPGAYARLLIGKLGTEGITAMGRGNIENDKIDVTLTLNEVDKVLALRVGRGPREKTIGAKVEAECPTPRRGIAR